MGHVNALILRTPLKSWTRWKFNQKIGKEQNASRHRSAQHALPSVWRNSIFFHRICRFSGGISFPTFSICLSMRRERIHSSLCFHYEHRRRAGSRTGQEGKLWTNTARFKPADLSPLLKGEIRWDCGVFVVLERDTQCVWMCTPPRHSWWCCLYQKLPQWGPGFPGVLTVLNLLRCLQVCGESGGYNTVLVFSYFSRISNQIQQLVLSSGCPFISQRLVSTLLRRQTKPLHTPDHRTWWPDDHTWNVTAN